MGDLDHEDLALLILMEDEESDVETSRSSECDIFKNRTTEGTFHILIRRHLITHAEKFREYFRLTPELFDFVLNHVREDLISKAYNRHKNPISPEEKLCIFIR